MRRTISVLAACFALILCASSVYAVPIEINYQGYLTDSGGTPVNGTTNITFKLYTIITALNPSWSEAISVEVMNGVYSVVLGATPGNEIDPSLFAGAPAFSIAVEGQDMPRQKLTSVAFAIRAASAEKADTVADGAVTNVMITGPIAASKIEQGPGSNLNADTVDGKQASDFVLKSGDTMSGALNLPQDGLAAGTNQLILSSGSVGIGTGSPTAKLDVFTAPVNTYGTWLPYDAYYNPCEHCIDTCDGNHTAEYSCRAGQTLACEDIRNDTGEDWEYRSVSCNQVQTAAQFTGNVRVMSGILTGNGSGLTNVNADLLDGQHSSEIIAAASDGIPPSWHQIIPAAQRFVLVMGGVAVLDKETGLVWQKAPSHLDTRDHAVYYCADLNLGGRKGWHLPTIEQLASLVDTSVSGSPKIPAGSPFSNVQAGNYWTASTYFPIDLGLTYAGVVDFSTGYAGLGIWQGDMYTWCVRGGQTYQYDYHF